MNSVLDNHFKADMTQEQGMECARQCIRELRTRFMINQHNFVGKIVTREGIKEVKFD